MGRCLTPASSFDVADTLSDTLVRGHPQCPADGIVLPMPCLKTTRPSTDTLELTKRDLKNRSGPPRARVLDPSVVRDGSSVERSRRKQPDDEERNDGAQHYGLKPVNQRKRGGSRIQTVRGAGSEGRPHQSKEQLTPLAASQDQQAETTPFGGKCGRDLPCQRRAVE